MKCDSGGTTETVAEVSTLAVNVSSQWWRDSAVVLKGEQSDFVH